MLHRLSAPPTMAASQTPHSINWRASMNVLALEAHAVETTIAGPRSASAARTKACQREHVLRDAVVERCRQGAGVRIARAVGFLAGQHARGAGAEDHRDAVGAVPVGCGRDGVGETVGTQREVGQPVVAAVEARQLGRQAVRFQSVDAADISVGHVAEVARTQRAASRPQCLQRRRGAATDRADDCRGSQDERVHSDGFRCRMRTLSREQEREHEARPARRSRR